MRQRIYLSYILLGCCVVGLLHLPKSWSQRWRSSSIALASVFWKKPANIVSQEDRLTVENLLLKTQNANLRSSLFSEYNKIEHQLKKLHSYEERGTAFFQRRKEYAKKILAMELFSLSSKIIYRDPAIWSSTIWINSGESDNERLGERVVAVNSPVLKGAYLVGVVEYVDRSRSRVRLLTDSALVPSVRVARGGGGARELLSLISCVREQLVLRDGVEKLLPALETISEYLECNFDERYLAKGELFGSSSPIWRARSHVLKGVGFNYDFADEEGPALELRTGNPLDRLGQQGELPLIQRGDLLVTTGMDGVFPADLPVAVVSSIMPLQEGNVTFNIEATLCAGNLHDLGEVTILPPIHFK